MKIDFFGTIEQTESMIKIFDKWARYFFNVFGCKRVDSVYNYITRLYYVRVEIPEEIYNYIVPGFTSEIVKKFQKEIELIEEKENGKKRIAIMIVNE